MKRTAIGLAILAGFSGAAYAGGSQVQLYGIIDMGLTHFNGIAAPGGGETSSTGLSSGVNDASRIGVKGTENLGGGLSALFQAETGFCAAGLNQDAPTTASSAYQSFCTGGGFMQRLTWVGLRGNFGTLKAGRMWLPIFLNESDIDPFGGGLTGEATNTSVVGQLFGGALFRASQMVQYVSPSLSGFKGSAAYSFAPGSKGTVPTASAGGSKVGRAIVLNGSYSNGPVYLNLDYTELTNREANPATGVNDGSAKIWQIGGAYDFHVMTLGADYERATVDYLSGNMHSWLLGATVPLGAGSLMLSYTENRNSLGMTTSGAAKQLAAGYQYNLSKRTSLWVSYARIRYGANAVTGDTWFGDSTDSFTPVANQTASGAAAGITVKF